MKYRCSWTPKGSLLLSDLKLKEWLYAAVQGAPTMLVAQITDAGQNTAQRPPPSGSAQTTDAGQNAFQTTNAGQNAFQHEVEFVVVQDSTSSSSDSSLIGRRQAYNFLVTFGPVDNGKLVPQAANLHLSTLISLGIESETRNTSYR